ncbi:MAG: hypothetical protein JOZ33_10580 [Acidobacteriaceae bacterium]|nr:hypothetical protein [Acidobacteriaceae bacterium]
MSTQAIGASTLQKHPGPPLWLLAILYTVLFLAGLYPVTTMAGAVHWPGPWESASVIVPYFQTHYAAVLTCIFLQLGATICLGLFCAATVSRLLFLRVRAAGPFIALFGGFLTVFDGIAAGMIVWTMIHPDVAANPSVLVGLYFLSYAFGGPGFSIPMGLLIAGVSISAGLMKLLPKWIVIFGLVLAVAGELSWLHLVIPGLLFLVPLVRFPGFVWLIAVGFALPRDRASNAELAAA